MFPLVSTISPFKYLPATVAFDPVYNMLNSLALLSDAEQLSHIRALSPSRVTSQYAVNDWLPMLAAALTPEQRHTNQLLFVGLRDALTPEYSWPDFPAYLADLRARPALALRDTCLRRICRRTPDMTSAPAPDTLLAHQDAYVAHACRLYPGNPAIHVEAYQLLGNPPALYDLIVLHLSQIWETITNQENSQHTRLGWEASQIQIFQQRLDPQAGAAETFRLFTGRALPPDVPTYGADVQQIILAPAPHNGRHISSWYSDGTLRLFFGPPPNYAILRRSSPVGQAELLAGLEALADSTRLHILELLSQHDELHAQEIIARLGLSQSSVSRHLKQLRPYLLERRGEGANKLYSLNCLGLDVTIRALQRLLAGATDNSENQGHEEQAQQWGELRRFLDEQGRITMWPAREKDKLLLLDYIVAQFAPGQFYTEKEVNTLLTERMHPHFKDFVSIRRALYDYGFLDRERDGSRYWRAESTPAVQD